MTVQLEYFDRLVVSTNRVASRSDLHYYLGQWVIRVSDGDLVAMLLSNTTHNARQAKKMKLTSYYPLKKVYKLTSSRNKMECFIYKVRIWMHSDALKKDKLQLYSHNFGLNKSKQSITGWIYFEHYSKHTSNIQMPKSLLERLVL